ncbi:MAG TPA: hypothetical protein VFC07_10510 [Verrucomicrobiae bacterium]|nr:hypothetical protein [Verrucomicrobiae bacterium]
MSEVPVRIFNHTARKPTLLDAAFGRGLSDYLSGFFGKPFAQVQVFFDFSAFVPVFLGFFGAVIGSAEGSLSASDGFGYHVQCFRHIRHAFLKVPVKRIPCQGRLSPSGAGNVWLDI